MPYRENNLALLKKHHPALVAVYESASGASVETFAAKNGLPVFRYAGAAFHGIMKPEEEGERLASAVPGGVKNVWVFGLGYGYHIAGLLKRGLNVTVFEPSPDIFKSAVENADMGAILEKAKIVVGGNIRGELEKADYSCAQLVPHRPYPRFFEKQWEKLNTVFGVRSFLAQRRLKVLLVGPIYGGTVPTFHYVRAALENIGAEVATFDAAQFVSGYFALDGVTSNHVHQAQLKRRYSDTLGEGVVAMADEQRPDLILVMAQAPLDTSPLSRLRELKVPIAFWFVEDFHTLTYWDRVAPLYDYFFTIQRGAFFDKLQAAGARRVAYLPQAASPAHHHPVALTPEEKASYGSDLSFMGAGYHNRKQFFHGLLDYDFKIWGTEWDLNTAVGERVQNRNRRMSPEEYTKVFCASKINLNLHSSTMLSGIDPVGDFVNPRVFELGACGAFSLVDFRAELPPLLEEGSEMATYRSLADLREKIDHYLAHPKDRERIAATARARVLEEHTFECRMESLLAAVIACEGPTFGAGRDSGAVYARNLAGKMAEEAADDPELVAFLKQFPADEVFSLKEAVDKINRGSGGLSRSESLLLMVNEVLIQG
ncbi:MAG: glycosyltransferase [Nitrospinae bacterium]|nr:glycosyltransferase [Nitrospinota bacterium]